MSDYYSWFEVVLEFFNYIINQHFFYKVLYFKGIISIINQKINSNYVNDIKKKNKCSKCGDNRWYVLDFHHLSDKKYV